MATTKVHLDSAEQNLLELLREAHQSLEHANKVWPQNSNVNQSKESLKKVIQIATQALVSVGKARSDL